MVLGGLLSVLPAPKHADERQRDEQTEAQTDEVVADHRGVTGPPPYGPGRSRYVPQTEDDFGDGGAFPEVHVLQYPLGMGRKRTAAGKGIVATRRLATKVGPDGQVDYAAIVKQGVAPGTVVHTGYNSVVEKSRDGRALAKPSDAEREETIRRTREALERRVQGKVDASKPTNYRGAGDERLATYIKYTAADADPRHNSGAGQRVIKMMEAPLDPLEPPKFRQHKAPPAPGSPPAPVMHSPPRKVSSEEAAQWKIPPCISNWKNIKGYTIPLDKRLAADGRGLQDTRINDNFAKFAESLYVAERTAREEVEKRAQIQKHIASKEKELKEQELRDLAARARAERAGIRPETPPAERPETPDEGFPARPREEVPSGPTESGGSRLASRPRTLIEDVDDGELSSEGEEAARRRDDIRAERRRERERDMRLRERAQEDAGITGKRSRLTRDRDRDFAEKVALGQAVGGAGGAANEVMYDQRLFNQATGGLDSGLAAQDSYNLYDKPLFSGGSSSFMYKAKRTETSDHEEPGTTRFKADRGFSGTERPEGERHVARNKPVEFERDEATSIRARTGGQDKDDVFGLDKFLSNAKRGRSERLDDALHERRRGGMLAGGSSGDALRESGLSDRKMSFRKGEAD